MKTLYSFTQVVAKIIEVLCWVMLGFVVALLGISFFSPDWLQSFPVQSGANNVDLSTNGYSITVFGSDGQPIILAVRMFAIGAIPIIGLMAMVFRNVYLIIKTMRGKTWFSKGDTPFQNDVTRMVREIGIFLLAIVVVGFVFSFIAKIVLDANGMPDAVNSSLNLETVVLGLLMLCLSSAFSQGETMQKEVDGLI